MSTTEHKSLAAALAAFQSALPPIAKDSTADAGSYTYKYAGLDVVSAAVLPLLGVHGLSFSSKPTLVDGKFVLEYALRHSSGEEDRGFYPLPSGQPQAVGSAITYARRYALMAVTGVFPGGEDDDGKAAKDTRIEPGPYWDPHDQAAERDGWEHDIKSAKTLDELKTVAGRIATAKRSGRLSPATVDHLTQTHATRKGELDQAAKEAASEQVSAGPVDPPAGGVGEAPEPGSGQPAQSARRTR